MGPNICLSVFLKTVMFQVGFLNFHYKEMSWESNNWEKLS